MTISESLEALTGRGRAHFSICSALADRGHRVTMVARNVDSYADQWRSIAAVREWPSQASAKILRRSPLSTGLGFMRLVDAIRRERPDVVYIPQRLLIPVGAVAARLSRRPAICHLHDQPKEWDRQDRLGQRWSTSFVAVSEAQAKAWQMSGVAGRFVVVHNGIDTERFSVPDEVQRRTARESFGIFDETPVVAFAGRIEEEKGLHVLIAASEILRSRDSRHELIVAGFETDHDYSAPLKASDAGRHAIWPGVIDPVQRVYWAADITVAPSVAHDPFPLSPLESMACGTPAIVSDKGGLPEGIPASEPQLVTRRGDGPELAQALQAAMSWRSERPEFGAQLREHITAGFSEPVMIDAVESIMLRSTESSV